MKIEIVSFGKIKHQFVIAGEAEYITRIKALARFTQTELGSPELGGQAEHLRREREGEVFLKHIKPGSCIIILDEGGRSFSSVELAEFVQKRMNGGQSEYCFAIGGPFGWSESVKARADLLLSFSRLTFPYQITRLLLTEQIYRIMTIIHHTPYHK